MNILKTVRDIKNVNKQTPQNGYGYFLWLEKIKTGMWPRPTFDRGRGRGQLLRVRGRGRSQVKFRHRGRGHNVFIF